MSKTEIQDDPLLARLPHEGNGVRIGNCIITERLGQGGMGAVYRGQDTKLDIPVAVKVLQFHLAETNPTMIDRFKREARTAARIDHHNLTRVFTVDEDKGVHYLVMEFVGGESIEERLEREGKFAERDALDVAIAVGEALVAAHAQGIMHRDVKPGNIMIRHTDGRVKLTDLGLAKFLAAKEVSGGGNITATGQMLGTPAFMSPEQARGGGKVDARADIYSLGATLFTMLANRYVFPSENVMQVIMAVINERAPNIRSIRPNVSDSTADLLRRMLANNRELRFGTMGETVAALKEARLPFGPEEGNLARPELVGKAAPDPDETLDARMLAINEELGPHDAEAAPGQAPPTVVDKVEPIRAPAKAAQRERRRGEVAARRRAEAGRTPPAAAVEVVHPRPAKLGTNFAIAAGVLVALALVGAAVWWLGFEVPRWRREVKYSSWMEKGSELEGEGNLLEAAEAFDTAARYEPKGGSQAAGEANRVRARHHAAVALDAFEKRDWDAAARGAKEALTHAPDSVAESVRKAVSSFEQAQKAFTSGSYARAVEACEASLDGRKSANARELLTRARRAYGATESLHAACKAEEMGEWKLVRTDLARAKSLGEQYLDQDIVTRIERALEYSDEMANGKKAIEEGDTAAAASHFRKALKLRPKDEAATQALSHVQQYRILIEDAREPLSTGDWRRAGKLLVEARGIFSGGDEARRLLDSTYVWDAASDRTAVVLSGHSAAVTCAVLLSGGTHVVTCSEDKTVRVWETRTGLQVKTHKDHKGTIRSLSVSPDGTRVVSASSDRTAIIWNAAAGKKVSVLRGHLDWVNSAAFSPDGNKVVTASGDRTARIWDVASGREIKLLRGHLDWVSSASFSSDGTRIVTTSNDKTARIWDAASGKEKALLQGHADWVTGVAFSPDGTRVVTCSNDNTARVWNAETGEEVAVLQGHKHWVLSACFSPGGRRILTTSNDNTARLWNAESGNEIAVLKAHMGPVSCGAFSPDGKRIATGSGDGMVRFWDARLGIHLAVLRKHSDGVQSLAFSSDGSRLVTASADKTACVWTAPTLAEAVRSR